MIPAHGYEAVFKKNGGGEYTRPVIAWDHEGRPLIAGTRGLVAVDEWSPFDFQRVEETAALHTILPGGGWEAEILDEETGQTHISPIIAWAVDKGGYGTAIVFHDQEAIPPVLHRWRPHTHRQQGAPRGQSDRQGDLMRVPASGLYFAVVPETITGPATVTDACPDCDADTTLTPNPDGSWSLSISHDGTCPAWRAIRAAR
ncbi:hypothetical protein [Acrocarpospora sp. B8E8]|uniref:hypothetical protein n=1 Tax=Acrocarpospora sp. B8E8 TaxID=3153572 RepID=UPI00325F8715